MSRRRRTTGCTGLLFVLAALAVGLSAAAAPVAHFTRGAAAGSPPRDVRFDASSSQDPSARIILYQWSFGDGYSGSGPVVTHRYAADGAYTVTLVVANDLGSRDVRSGLIQVPGSAEVFWFGTEVGQAAPVFEMPDLDGKTVRLSDLRGQVVLLEFWSSTCGQCTKTLPHLADLAKRYAKRGLALVGVSIDSRPDGARQYLSATGIPMRCLWGPKDAGAAVLALYDAGSVPHTFLIDRLGVIRYSGTPGELTEEDVEPWL